MLLWHLKSPAVATSYLYDGERHASTCTTMCHIIHKQLLQTTNKKHLESIILHQISQLRAFTNSSSVNPRALDASMCNRCLFSTSINWVCFLKTDSNSVFCFSSLRTSASNLSDVCLDISIFSYSLRRLSCTPKANPSTTRQAHLGFSRWLGHSRLVPLYFFQGTIQSCFSCIHIRLGLLRGLVHTFQILHATISENVH